jgi:hypothetical protein
MVRVRKKYDDSNPEYFNCLPSLNKDIMRQLITLVRQFILLSVGVNHIDNSINIATVVARQTLPDTFTIVVTTHKILVMLAQIFSDVMIKPSHDEYMHLVNSCFNECDGLRVMFAIFEKVKGVLWNDDTIDSGGEVGKGPVATDGSNKQLHYYVHQIRELLVVIIVRCSQWFGSVIDLKVFFPSLQKSFFYYLNRLYTDLIVSSDKPVSMLNSTGIRTTPEEIKTLASLSNTKYTFSPSVNYSCTCDSMLYFILNSMFSISCNKNNHQYCNYKELVPPLLKLICMYNRYNDELLAETAAAVLNNIIVFSSAQVKNDIFSSYEIINKIIPLLASYAQHSSSQIPLQEKNLGAIPSTGVMEVTSTPNSSPPVISQLTQTIHSFCYNNELGVDEISFSGLLPRMFDCLKMASKILFDSNLNLLSAIPASLKSTSAVGSYISFIFSPQICAVLIMRNFLSTFSIVNYWSPNRCDMKFFFF